MMKDDRFEMTDTRIFHSIEDCNTFNRDWTIHWAKANGFDVIHEKDNSTLCEMHGTNQYFEVFEDGSWEAFGMKPEGEKVVGSNSKMLQIYCKIPEDYQEIMKS